MSDDCDNKAIREIMSELQVILGDKNASVMSRVGRSMAIRWIEGKSFETPQELLEAVAKYFQDELDLTEITTVDYDESGKASLNIEGCKPCCGNLVKAKGGTPACPMSSFALTALKKMFPDLKKVQLDGIEKKLDENQNALVGICYQKLTIEI